jgi:hypothetical protein
MKTLIALAVLAIAALGLTAEAKARGRVVVRNGAGRSNVTVVNGRVRQPNVTIINGAGINGASGGGCNVGRTTIVVP